MVTKIYTIQQFLLKIIFFANLACVLPRSVPPANLQPRGPPHAFHSHLALHPTFFNHENAQAYQHREPTGTFYDSKRGILRSFPGGGVPVLVDHHKRCSGNFVGVKAHPNQKQYYYVCKPDCVIFGKCQNLQSFDATKGQCSPYPAQEYTPVCVKPGRFPILTDCTVYYRCDAQLKPRIYSCPRNTVYSPRDEKCICGAKCNPTEVTSHGSYIPHDCEHKFPPCLQDGTFRTPTDCSLYYTCVMQPKGIYQQTRFKCPELQFFDPKLVTCRPQHEVPCDSIQLSELVYPRPPPLPHLPVIYPPHYSVDSLDESDYPTENAEPCSKEDPLSASIGSTENEISDWSSQTTKVTRSPTQSTTVPKTLPTSRLTPIHTLPTTTLAPTTRVTRTSSFIPSKPATPEQPASSTSPPVDISLSTTPGENSSPTSDNDVTSEEIDLSTSTKWTTIDSETAINTAAISSAATIGSASLIGATPTINTFSETSPSTGTSPVDDSKWTSTSLVTSLPTNSNTANSLPTSQQDFSSIQLGSFMNSFAPTRDSPTSESNPSSLSTIPTSSSDFFAQKSTPNDFASITSSPRDSSTNSFANTKFTAVPTAPPSRATPSTVLPHSSASTTESETFTSELTASSTPASTPFSSNSISSLPAKRATASLPPSSATDLATTTGNFTSSPLQSTSALFTTLAETISSTESTIAESPIRPSNASHTSIPTDLSTVPDTSTVTQTTFNLLTTLPAHSPTKANPLPISSIDPQTSTVKATSSGTASTALSTAASSTTVDESSLNTIEVTSTPTMLTTTKSDSSRGTISSPDFTQNEIRSPDTRNTAPNTLDESEMRNIRSSFSTGLITANDYEENNHTNNKLDYNSDEFENVVYYDDYLTVSAIAENLKSEKSSNEVKNEQESTEKPIVALNSRTNNTTPKSTIEEMSKTKQLDNKNAEGNVGEAPDSRAGSDVIYYDDELEYNDPTTAINEGKPSATHTTSLKEAALGIHSTKSGSSTTQITKPKTPKHIEITTLRTLRQALPAFSENSEMPLETAEVRTPERKRSSVKTKEDVFESSAKVMESKKSRTEATTSKADNFTSTHHEVSQKAVKENPIEMDDQQANEKEESATEKNATRGRLDKNVAIKSISELTVTPENNANDAKAADDKQEFKENSAVQSSGSSFEADKRPTRPTLLLGTNDITITATTKLPPQLKTFSQTTTPVSPESSTKSLKENVISPTDDLIRDSAENSNETQQVVQQIRVTKSANTKNSKQNSSLNQNVVESSSLKTPATKNINEQNETSTAPSEINENKDIERLESTTEHQRTTVSVTESSTAATTELHPSTTESNFQIDIRSAPSEENTDGDQPSEEQQSSALALRTDTEVVKPDKHSTSDDSSQHTKSPQTIMALSTERTKASKIKFARHTANAVDEMIEHVNELQATGETNLTTTEKSSVTVVKTVKPQIVATTSTREIEKPAESSNEDGIRHPNPDLVKTADLNVQSKEALSAENSKPQLTSTSIETNITTTETNRSLESTQESNTVISEQNSHVTEKQNILKTGTHSPREQVNRKDEEQVAHSINSVSLNTPITTLKPKVSKVFEVATTENGKDLNETTSAHHILTASSTLRPIRNAVLGVFEANEEIPSSLAPRTVVQKQEHTDHIDQPAGQLQHNQLNMRPLIESPTAANVKESRTKLKDLLGKDFERADANVMESDEADSPAHSLEKSTGLIRISDSFQNYISNEAPQTDGLAAPSLPAVPRKISSEHNVNNFTTTTARPTTTVHTPTTANFTVTTENTALETELETPEGTTAQPTRLGIQFHDNLLDIKSNDVRITRNAQNTLEETQQTYKRMYRTQTAKSNQNSETVTAFPMHATDIPKLELVVFGNLDLTVLYCPKDCSKDHQHKYDKKVFGDQHVVGIQWDPSKSKKTMSLQTV
ncbi:uncharacterized protein LOC101450831 [Ceratitis capitata]|uniref:uncharacterized protein LOC101450831 n=1 Tax=Ceratitis capitata TaxID=7213 RepID=UPI00032A306F|nr:uncharacterized protein LOC101450831 [Ceratitis capitata]